MEAMGHEHVVEAIGHEHVMEAMGHEHVMEAMGHEHVVEAIDIFDDTCALCTLGDNSAAKVVLEIYEVMEIYTPI